MSWLFAPGSQNIGAAVLIFIPSNEYSGLISFRKICLHLISKFSHVILPQNHIPNSLYFWGAPKSLQMVTAAMKLKDAYSLEEKL